MKIKFIILIILFLLAGYILGNLFPFTMPQVFKKSIEGNARLEVKLIIDNGEPLAMIEVDVAEKPGPPPIGGVTGTNDQGIAVFNIKPGQYSIFFNQNSFPKNLVMPATRQIQVNEEVINQETIVVEVKQ